MPNANFSETLKINILFAKSSIRKLEQNELCEREIYCGYKKIYIYTTGKYKDGPKIN